MEPKFLEQFDSPEQIFHQRLSLGAPDSRGEYPAFPTRILQHVKHCKRARKIRLKTFASKVHLRPLLIHVLKKLFLLALCGD